MSQPVLKLQNLNKSFGALKATSDLSMTVMPGEIHALIGPNGAGKTSLFKALAGLTKIDQGALSFFGKNLNSMNLEERSNAGLNYVPQENSLFDDLTLKENLQAVIELKFKNITQEKSSQLEKLLRIMNLENKSQTKAKFLSGGEKRKTEILRSILLDAKFILLDEPFAGVDPISVEEIIKMLKTFKKDLGIFISDHNFRDVINVCDEIILLNQGELLLQGTPKQVKNNPIAKKLYFGELN
mgnify:CR=1 FL=1